jgi:hypothetical protein
MIQNETLEGYLVWIPANVGLMKYSYRTITKKPFLIKEVLEKYNFSSPNQVVPTDLMYTKKPGVALILSDKIQELYEVMWEGEVWYVNKKDVRLINK